MFSVRSARALAPQALSRAFSPCMSLVVPPPCTPGPPASRLAPLPPASHALPSTRQGASAFNQPLSFDTSSVTNMYQMFNVRSARALGPQASSQAPCMQSLPPRIPSLPPPGTHLAPHYTRPPFDSGRAQTPCPPPTSCSSAARGRAPRPSPPLAMARAGLREAARERSSARELLRLILIPYLREPQQHPYRTLTVWSRLVSATAFVAFELYDARFFRALQSERVRCVDVLR